MCTEALITIFARNKAVSLIAAEHLQRSAVLLSSFNYSIDFKTGVEHGNTDALFHAPVNNDVVPSEKYKVSYCESLLIMSRDIVAETKYDTIPGRVLKYVKNSSPSKSDCTDLKLYSDKNFKCLLITAFFEE